MNKLFACLAMAFAAPGIWAGDAALTLNVAVSGAQPPRGQITATLFTSAQTYMKEPAAEQSAAVDVEGRAAIEFKGLTAGAYAVAVVHDANSDGELNTNLFGIPTEKFGFSNNAKAWFGPPAFSAAEFSLTSSTGAIAIDLNQAE